MVTLVLVLLVMAGSVLESRSCDGFHVLFAGLVPFRYLWGALLLVSYSQVSHVNSSYEQAILLGACSLFLFSQAKS